MKFSLANLQPSIATNGLRHNQVTLRSQSASSFVKVRRLPMESVSFSAPLSYRRKPLVLPKKIWGGLEHLHPRPIVCSSTCAARRLGRSSPPVVDPTIRDVSFAQPCRQITQHPQPRTESRSSSVVTWSHSFRQQQPSEVRAVSDPELACDFIDPVHSVTGEP